MDKHLEWLVHQWCRKLLLQCCLLHRRMHTTQQQAPQIQQLELQQGQAQDQVRAQQPGEAQQRAEPWVQQAQKGVIAQQQGQARQ
jgi:hypothetical protein